MNGYKSNTNGESLYLFHSEHLKSRFFQISWLILSITFIQSHWLERASINYLKDPDYESCEESSFFDEESESDFEDFACRLSPSARFPSNERALIVSESKVTELLTSRAKCGFKINQNLIRDGKNTGSG